MAGFVVKTVWGLKNVPLDVIGGMMKLALQRHGEKHLRMLSKLGWVHNLRKRAKKEEKE